MIYPATSQSGVDVRHCTMMSIVTSLEAFIGVLFASVCGAIIFIKVSRIQSFAQVEFSDPVCIRYGMGVKIECDDDCIDSDNGSQSYECGSDNLPCPILEFRVVNRMHNVPGGEIIDASVNVVACIDASQACPTLKDSLSQRREGKKGKKRVVRNRGALMRRLVSLNGSSLANLDQSSRDALTMSSTNRTRELSTDSIFSKFSRGKRMKDVSTGSLSSRFDADFSKATTLSRQNQAFEEDPSGHLVPKIILSKLKCETQNHPFFKRVFIVRHTLDRHSPLLKAEPRQLIKQNHGCWPNELNSPECVRDSIHFDQLLISLTGTSNADANTVYAQHVYDFVDVHVGYRFVNMMYREPGDETLLVDKSLLNDVMEQAGGGGETFAWDHALKEKEILVL